MSKLENWRHKVHEIPRAGVSQHREANEELRQSVADELGEPECQSLVADYKIKNLGKGRFGLSGSVDAVFTRACVVTLEPLQEDVHEVLDCVFVPPEYMPGQQAEEEEALSAEEYEPIKNETLEVGRVIFEVLSAGLDPYPRAEGASLGDAGQDDGQETAEEGAHPFAALAQLKKDRDNTP